VGLPVKGPSIGGTIISRNRALDSLPKIVAAGLLTGILTPLFQPVVNSIAGTHGDFRIALLALPLAVLSRFCCGGWPQIHGGWRWPPPSSR
jgi:hypothetical protein